MRSKPSVVAVGVVCALMGRTAFADSLTEAVKREARVGSAQQSQSKGLTENRYFVPGITLLAVGGGVLLYGATHETGVTCTSTLTTVGCETTKSAGTMIAGAAIAATGGILLMKGRTSPELVPQVGGIGIRQRISWK
jgi:hypothetical protein